MSSLTLVLQKKFHLKCQYLNEGRKKNNSLSIVSCIYIENIETERTGADSLQLFYSILCIEREIILYVVKTKKSARRDRCYVCFKLMSVTIVSTVQLQNDNILKLSQTSSETKLPVTTSDISNICLNCDPNLSPYALYPS